MSSEDLCAVDYVVMLLLEKFKGKTEIDRLESYMTKNASEDIKAIVRCTGGLRGFLKSQSESFVFDSVNVSCKEDRKPSKESDVIKWFRGRLKTSPRRIFSLQALQKMIENGPPGIQSYFSFVCPTTEKLREWFLQRTQIFKESPAGNISLSDCEISPTADNGVWCCIDFFVKILDEQGCDTLSVDWACLFNYVFIAENPVIMSRITALYEEATFENFFKSNAIQFGLEVQDGQLCRSSDPANSGVEIASAGPSEPQPVQEEEKEPVVLCLEFLKTILADKTSLPVSELQKIFCKKSPKAAREYLQKRIAQEPFEEFLAAQGNIFVLSPDNLLVSLKDEAQASDTSSEITERTEKNPKHDRVLYGVFRDLLLMAGNEQGVHHVDVQRFASCVQLLPKHLITYFSDAYSSPTQFFKEYEAFRLKKRQKIIGLKEKAESSDSGRPDVEAPATHTLNFFVQAFAILHCHGVKFIPPSQLDLLTCLLNSTARAYIETNFGSKKAPLKNLLMRFPDLFSESRAGNISLRNPKIDGRPFDDSNEILTNTKAICTYPNEASAIEFYLRSLTEVSAQCYPVPMWWCTAKMQDAPRHVISFLEETYPGKNLGEFFAKFPAVFCYASETSAVYLQVGPLTSGHDIPVAAAASELHFEDEQIIFGLLAGLCFASCAPISMSLLLQTADKHFILPEVEAVIAERSGRNQEEKFRSILQKFEQKIVALNGNTVTLRWPDQFHAELQTALEQTLCQIIRNTVVHLATEAGLFPAISKVFDQLQSSLGNLFSSFVVTLSDLLEFLDKFNNVFMVNGSTNTIIVRDFGVEVSYSNVEIPDPLASGSQYATTHGAAAAATRTAFPDQNRIRSWIDQRRKAMETWTSVAPLVNGFVRQMDLDTVTHFSAVHGLGDGLNSVLKEIERLMKVNAIDSALQLMGLYWEKNTVFFCELLVTIYKVSSFIVKDRNCFSTSCGCQKPLKFHRFEDFVDFCSSIRFHLEQGPFPGVLTPSSSGSSSSTPEIFDRFSQWGDSETSPLNLVLEDKSLEEVQERLRQLPADYGLWGLNLPSHTENFCWPKSIWEPTPDETGAAGEVVTDMTFRVSSVNLGAVTAESVSDSSKKLRVDWPSGTLKVGDELSLTVRPKR